MASDKAAGVDIVRAEQAISEGSSTRFAFASVTTLFFAWGFVTSLIGRGMRFFLVAGLMRWGGEKMERKLMHYVDVLGWLCIGLAVVAYFWFSR